MNCNVKDEDSVFLQQVLDKLYDFESTQTKKKKKKSNKRKRCEEEEEEETASQKEVGTNVEDRCEDLNETAGHPGGRQAGEGVEVVTFQDPHKKVRTQRAAAPSNEPPRTHQRNQPGELSLETVRLEVHRFGITGFQKEQQRVFERDRVVMLGARPPKKSYVNYKLLQEQMKEKKQRARQEVQSEPKKKKKRNQVDKKKKVSGSAAAPTGQVGRYKDGMLILSSKEIQKIKGQRGAK